MRRSFFLTAFLIAGLSASAATAGSWLWNHHGPTYDHPDWQSKLDLGIDISMVGSTPADVRVFFDRLPGQTQREVWGGCHTFLAWPGNVQMDTLMFCRMLLR